MKRISKTFIVLLSVLFCSVIFCSYSKNNIKTVKGYIQSYGNVPFTYLGIKTTDDKEYGIVIADEVISELKASQGKLIEVTGLIINLEKDKNILEPGMLKDGKIEVIEWRVLE